MFNRGAVHYKKQEKKEIAKFDETAVKEVIMARQMDELVTENYELLNDLQAAFDDIEALTEHVATLTEKMKALKCYNEELESSLTDLELAYDHREAQIMRACVINAEVPVPIASIAHAPKRDNEPDGIHLCHKKEPVAANAISREKLPNLFTKFSRGITEYMMTSEKKSSSSGRLETEFPSSRQEGAFRRRHSTTILESGLSSASSLRNFFEQSKNDTKISARGHIRRSNTISRSHSINILPSKMSKLLVDFKEL